jgi:hypothetical protein
LIEGDIDEVSPMVSRRDDAALPVDDGTLSPDIDGCENIDKSVEVSD